MQFVSFDVETHFRMHAEFVARLDTLHERMQNVDKRGVEQTMFGM
jgi:hypothetical protein